MRARSRCRRARSPSSRGPHERGWARRRRGAAAAVDVAVDLRRRERAWPSSSWIVRRSAPPSSRCVAKAWRSLCGWGSRRRSVLVSSRRPRAERKSGVLRAACELRAAPRGGSARAGTPPPRRAARSAPCRPCRARGRSSWSKSTSWRSSADRLGAAQSGGVDELDQGTVPQAERPVALDASSSASISAGFGAIGSRRGRFGASDASGTRAGRARSAAARARRSSFLPIVAGASFGRCRPSSAT